MVCPRIGSTDVDRLFCQVIDCRRHQRITSVAWKRSVIRKNHDNDTLLESNTGVYGCLVGIAPGGYTLSGET
jgi:hypothetical protein